MVIGLPLAPFNRVRRMMIEYFRHKFGDEGEFLCYTLPAINRSLQALGRVLQSAKAGCIGDGRKEVPGKTGASCTPCVDPERDDRMRCSTVQGDDFTVEITGGSSQLRALVRPRMVERNDRSPCQVCKNRNFPGGVPDLIRLYCSGQVTSLLPLDSVAINDDSVYSRIYGPLAGSLRVHVNIRGDCRKGRDIPPCRRAGDGT